RQIRRRQAGGAGAGADLRHQVLDRVGRESKHKREFGAMNASALSSWQFWAVLSAVFAALTAIFAKVGVENINSDLATFVRTIVILFVLGGLLAALGLFQPLGSICFRTYLFLALSGCATGASWICYFRALQLGDAARVAPI